MSSLQLPGLFTGIDTSALINQLMALERRTLTLYEQRQTVWNDRKKALGTLETNLSALRSAAVALSDISQLRAFTTASSNEDVVTAEASHNAFEGNHTIVVNQLANAERWAHTAGVEYAEDSIGAGTFVYSYNHQETIITTTAETTLEDLVGLINNDANNPGVTAHLLYYGGTYHLMLNGNEAGSDYAVSINASNTEVWQAASPLTANSANAALATEIIDLDQFDGTLVGDESITISGTRHDGTAVNQVLAVHGSTKLSQLLQEIEDAFGGTATATLVDGQIRLTDNTSGASQMTLSLTYNAGSGATTFDLPAFSRSTQGGSVAAGLAGFAAADFTRTQAAQDAQIKVDGYPPGPDEWITRSSNTIADVLNGVTLHLHDTGTAQVTLTRDTESVRTKLDALVSAYNATVTFLHEKQGYNEDTKRAGILMGDGTVSQIVEALRLPLIQPVRGFIVGTNSFLLPGHIGLELDDEGKLSLSSTTLDEALADDYQGVLALIGADKTGSSDSNTIQFYAASGANTTAGTYNVEVTISAGVITTARIQREGDAAWRNATINGNTIIGDSTFDEQGNPVYPENGLQLTVDLSQEGTFTATVRVQQGCAGAMEEALDRILDATTGTLTLDRRRVDDQIKHLQDRIEIEEERLSRREAQLVAKYARLERTLALLQTQMAALGMQTTPA